MSTSTLPNLSCGRCHRPQAHLSGPLQLCSRCRSIRYCSRDCQRRDWPSHKPQCQTGTVRDRVRTPMRLNLTDLNRILSETEDGATPQ
ncbi:hypothetical protein Tdes44962_MAKER03022 [Teratosphaeria destructans]|uniref:MYND-type domain-containing protein n=1 Tax=Teratosphaeria destructans TaxID=418781 RepID=A0A9W7W1W0_9PEZI|nr:hypothetical protein Tdes44962_MAKER03022 [Teratosphaeria destructans]